MALHEKNLPFESRVINLASNEQYEPWFLLLNPKGEVPVLQDTGKIIPDSTRIIDYLEDNFSNGKLDFVWGGGGNIVMCHTSDSQSVNRLSGPSEKFEIYMQ